MRGGFVTPDGLRVDLGVRMDTLVNGKLLLRSVFTPSLGIHERVQVYAPPGATAAKMDKARQAKAPPQSPAGPGLSFSFKPESGPGAVRPTPAAPQPRVSVNTSPTAAVLPSDAAVLPVIPNGAPVVTDDGRVRLENAPTGPAVIFESDSLQVRHLLASTANVVANTANDRIITSNTTVGITLPNATPLNLGSAALRAQDAALAATRRLIR
jgi:hypothetical protein